MITYEIDGTQVREEGSSVRVSGTPDGLAPCQEQDGEGESAAACAKALQAVVMEDAEAIEICHRATRFEQNAAAVLEMGGRGPIADQPTRLTDVPVRGFFSYYTELMGIAPQGACR